MPILARSWNASEEVIIKKKSKPSKTKLADTWQDRRIQAMNRKIRKSRSGTAMTDKYLDEYSAVSASKAPSKKVYKSDKKAIIFAKNVQKQSQVYKSQLRECEKSLNNKYIIF